ncbi:MAG: hypothetical protein FWC55_09010, partial [Firmicutes bacterium]|nr:hypothetical protein [Bacillota bacterium]
MKKFFRAVSAALVVSMLVSLPAVTTPVRAAADMRTVNGVLDIEAENAIYNADRFWVKSDAMFSGNEAIGPLAEDKTSPLPNDAPPDVDLSFIADQAGTYNVWVRCTSSLPDTS